MYLLILFLELNAAEKFKLWLKNRYIDAQNLLLRMLQHREASVQVNLLFEFVQ